MYHILFYGHLSSSSRLIILCAYVFCNQYWLELKTKSVTRISARMEKISQDMEDQVEISI